MRTITVTAARRRFGALLDAAQREPMLICRKNRGESVIMSVEEYARMRDINGCKPKRVMPRPQR